MLKLKKHQRDAIARMHDGCLLVGGTGSGKSITSVWYYYHSVCSGDLLKGKKMTRPIPLYIITTARKRDSHEWEAEIAHFGLSTNPDISIDGVKVVIDSWNNIEKYVDIEDAFFIFDEQRVVGYGTWAKTFIKIAHKNKWILLSATPGDCWSDYIPVFIANYFYKNKTEFERRHVVYDQWAKFPKIKMYIDVPRLIAAKKKVVVEMDYIPTVEKIKEYVRCEYDKALYNDVLKRRWDIYSDEPCAGAAQVCQVLRHIVNSDDSRWCKCYDLIQKHPRTIIFYNYNYELEILENRLMAWDIPYTQWNGHKHEMILDSDKWVYLAQYTAACEGWNCIATDTIIFWSESYSYKAMKQAEGRIDRLNTPFDKLYYFYLNADSGIERAIHKALKEKKDFNENRFVV